MNKILALVFSIMILLVSGCLTSDTGSLQVDERQCIGCRDCANVCKADAVRIISNKAIIDPAKCIACGNCVEVCPVKAIY